MHKNNFWNVQNAKKQSRKEKDRSFLRKVELVLTRRRRKKSKTQRFRSKSSGQLLHQLDIFGGGGHSDSSLKLAAFDIDAHILGSKKGGSIC
jgi:hypothetical protein